MGIGRMRRVLLQSVPAAVVAAAHRLEAADRRAAQRGDAGQPFDRRRDLETTLANVNISSSAMYKRSPGSNW